MTNEIRNYISRMYPDRDFTQKQIDFFKCAFERFKTDNDTSRITVFPARCGLGKSTLIQMYIMYCINHDRGIVVVTDSIKRLETIKNNVEQANTFERFINSNREHISLITAENVNEEMQLQRYKPILLVTTQRFFSADTATIKSYLDYEWNGEKSKRKQIIFDEKPYFYDVVKIGIHELNCLDSALNDGITDKCQPNDKEWILGQFKTLDNYLRNEINHLEYTRKTDTYLYWTNEYKTTLSDDDRRFYGIVNVNYETIYKIYPKAKETLQLIGRLLVEGGFFKSAKATERNSKNIWRKYEKYFFLIQDYTEKYLLNDASRVKVFVFDGTAEISYLYNELLDMFDVVGCDEFNVPLDYMHIHLIDVNTSKNALALTNANRENRIIAIKNYLKKQQLNLQDTLLVTYRTLLDEGVFNDIEFQNKGYFGNMKGFNDYSGLHNIVQIGMNRQPDINYVLATFFTQPEYYEYAKKRYYDGSCVEWFDELQEDNEVMYSELSADTIQNIYRTAARYYDNTAPVNVYLFFNVRYMGGIINDLRYEFERNGAHLYIEELPELQEIKAKNRKSANGETVVQKILHWVETQPNERMFSSADIIAELGITTMQLKNVKHNSRVVREKLAELKIPGCNKYKKGCPNS